MAELEDFPAREQSIDDDGRYLGQLRTIGLGRGEWMMEQWDGQWWRPVPMFKREES